MFLKIKENKILSEEKINSGRQLEIDIAKGFSIIGMIFSHTFEHSGYDYTSTFSTSIITNYLAGFLGAPLFMLLMGFGIFYSKTTSPKKVFERGVLLLFIGYILNVFKYFIPSLILGNTNYLLTQLLNLDILQFAGLGLILFSSLLKLKCSNIVMLAIGVLTSFLGTIYNNCLCTNTYIAKVLGLFIGIDGTISFPLLNWFIFIPLGYIFAELYSHIKNKDRFYLIIGLPLLIIGLALTIYKAKMNIGFMNNSRMYYFNISTIDSLIAFITIIGFMTIYYLFTKIFHKKVLLLLQYFSQNIMLFYIVHIVLIRLIIYLVLKEILLIQFTPILLYTLAFFIAIITYLIVKLIKKRSSL